MEGSPLNQFPTRRNKKVKQPVAGIINTAMNSRIVQEKYNGYILRYKALEGTPSDIYEMILKMTYDTNKAHQIQFANLFPINEN
jgi:hypothetical protein